MRRIKPEVDVIRDILNAVGTARPSDAFVQSLTKQYNERGSLSKKQLEGLKGKAERIKEISPARLATLEAILLRMHTKNKSEKPVATPLYEKDEATGLLIQRLLGKYPAHKRILFLQNKYDHNDPLTAAELGELERFAKLLLK